MQQSLHVMLAVSLMSTTMLTQAHAQDATNNNTQTTEEVTVYATRSAQPTFNAPAMVDTIDLDEAENANVNDIQDLLKFVPNVEVLNGTRRSSQTVSIRGFDDEQIIILMDGRRQNMSSGHDGRFFVDPNLLKSVEIVKGGASSIYGGGGIGGVIAFETKDAADLLEPGETLGGHVSASYGSASRDKTTNMAAYARDENFDIIANANFRDAGDIEQGNGVKLEAEDKIVSGLFKLGYTFGDFNTVKGEVKVHNQDSEEPTNSAGSITSSNPIVDKEIEDYQFSLKYEYENPANQLLQPKLHLYYNDTEVNELNISGSNDGRLLTRKYDTLGFTAENQTKLMQGDVGKHTLSYGGEFYNDKIKGTNSLPSATYGGVPVAKSDTYGLFVQDEFSAYNGDVRVSFIPAVRFDSYSSSDDDGNSKSESAISPKLSISVEPNRNLMFFGSMSDAFRAPDLVELYADGQHYPGNNFVQNTDLKSETVVTAEIGAGFKIPKLVTDSDLLKVKGAIFKSKGENFISQEFTSTTTQYVNVANAEIEGWELEADYNIDLVTLNASFSRSKATNSDTGAYLDQSVPLTLITGLNYEVPSIDSEMGFKAKFVKANNEVSSASNSRDGYGVADVYLRWQPESMDDSLLVDLGINNVTDKAYTSNFAGLYEEGRSYVGKVTYKW